MSFPALMILRQSSKRLANSHLLFVDLFNREDSSSMGDPWVVNGSVSWGISDEQAQASTDSVSAISGVVTVNVSESNVLLKTDVMLWPASGRRGGCLVRGDGTVSNGWFVLLDNTGVNLRLTKIVGGSSTDEDTVAFTPVIGQMYTIEVKAKDSAIVVSVDGEELLEATDDTLTDKTYCGLWASVISNVVAICDNFKVWRQ